jgi:hypothetical protein
MSAVPLLLDKNAETSVGKCIRVEEQEDVWLEAQRIGPQIGDQLRKR